MTEEQNLQNEKEKVIKKKGKNLKIVRCKSCGSTLNYIKFRTNQRKCRTCGYIENLEDNISENLEDDIKEEEKV